MRVGLGFDAHRFGGTPPLRLAGVVVSDRRGLEGTSDADVVAHAVADALLGAAALGDLGVHFPSSDPSVRGMDSMRLLRRVVELLAEAGHRPSNVDVVVVAQSVRVAPHREEMRRRLAATLGLDHSRVSVKATTTDRMGAVGRDEGIAAQAVATITDPAPRGPLSDRR